ncbi:MAG: transglycosylase domain-containing protein [Bacilli bacterium]|nr:transglycosylase domain-containing protein [Bacilli bacterium]
MANKKTTKTKSTSTKKINAIKKEIKELETKKTKSSTKTKAAVKKAKAVPKKKTTASKSTNTKKKVEKEVKVTKVQETKEVPKKRTHKSKNTITKKVEKKQIAKPEVDIKVEIDKDIKKIERNKVDDKPKSTVKKTKKVNTLNKQNNAKGLKKVLNCIKIVLITIIRVIVIVFISIGKFFKWIWNGLKEIDRKDAEKKKNKKLNKLKKYNVSDFDESLTKDITRKDLKLLSYKEHKNWIAVFFINRGRVLKFDMKKFKNRIKYGTLWNKILILMMLFMIFVFCCFIGLVVYVIYTAPDIDKDRLYKENSTVLYDKYGNEFARIGTENREKVTYDDLPQVLVDAIVATEDSRFFQHNGIDIARFTKASIGQVLGKSDAGGGSTLTMQLSKNSATSSEAHGIKGIIRKFQDIYLAVFVYEKQYTKEQIMEFYVNNAYLGSAYGVQQASRAYFGKDVSDLNLAEASMIAGLFQLPYAYNPYNHPAAAEKRRNTVLNLMERHGYISTEEKEAAQAVPVKSLLTGYNTELNEHIRFIDTVVEEVLDRTGYDPYQVSMEIYTTMDPAKQTVINKIQNGQFKELGSDWKYKNEYSENGIALLSIEDGSIVAIGTGRNKKSQRSFNYATEGRRHPGSTAKPVVDYGPAIEYLGWGSGNPVVDREYEYTGGGKIKNWDGKYDNSTTVKSALAKSRNIPALQTFKLVPNDQKLTFATNLGWKLEMSGDQILETCSIGGFTGVTPVESAAAYAAFARGGTYIEPYSFTKAIFNETGDEYIVYPKKVQAMSEETAYIITDILKYAVTSGTVGVGSVSGTEIASKTGTSTVDSATLKRLNIKGSIDGDVWQVAYSQDLVVSLWYSYPTLSSEHYLTAKEGTDSRKAIIKLLTKNLFNKNVKFRKPSGVTTATIELETYPVKLASEYTPKELKSTEMFNKNSVPTEKSERFSQLNNPTNLKYTYSDGVIQLTWDDVPLPDAVSESAIREYFTNNPIYSYWKDIYISERLAYNEANIGKFGYEIYITDGSGTRNLGFVTDNKFTYTNPISSGTSFTVKSAYSIFKDNKSAGVSVNINNSTQPGPTPVETGSIQLTLPQCITKDKLISYLNKGENLKYLSGVLIKDKDTNLKDRTSTSLDLSCSSGKNAQCIDEINNAGDTYTALFIASSNGYSSINQQTTIKNQC